MNMLLHSLNQNLTLFLVIPLIFIVGLYLTFRMRGVQFRRLKEGFCHLVMKGDKAQGNLSNFQAISTVLAGNLGTGNISGMAIALSIGGPGSLFWMWVMALLGAIIKYAGCFLGFEFRRKNEEGEYVGGPMYYLARGLNQRTLAILFALFCIASSFTVGNLVQVNSLILPFKEMGMNALILAIVLAILVGIVVIRGITRFALVAEVLVPLMGFAYLLFAAVILFIHHDKILSSLSLIFTSAFSFKTVAGGMASYGFFHAITSGFERGIFATDAGIGIAPILQASAKEKDQVLEGYVGMTAPFFVMVICTFTVLVLMVTGAWTQPNLTSTNMCGWAFEKGLSSRIGFYVIAYSLFFFGYTTILAWATAGIKSVEFLFGLKACKWYKLLFVLFIPVGIYLKAFFVWTLADITLSLMLITNLIGVIGLSKKVISATNSYEL